MQINEIIEANSKLITFTNNDSFLNPMPQKVSFLYEENGDFISIDYDNKNCYFYCEVWKGDSQKVLDCKEFSELQLKFQNYLEEEINTVKNHYHNEKNERF